MSQTVSSASKIAVMTAFRRARHKFPINFGCAPTESVKPYEQIQKRNVIEKKEQCMQDLDHINEIQKKEACEKWIEDSISNTKNCNKSKSTCRICVKKDFQNEKEYKYDDPFESGDKKHICIMKNTNEGELRFENSVPIYHAKTHCIHHCSKCHYNDFTKKLYEWECRIHKAMSRPVRQLYRTRTAPLIKNTNQYDFSKLGKTSSFHNHQQPNYCSRSRRCCRFDRINCITYNEQNQKQSTLKEEQKYLGYNKKYTATLDENKRDIIDTHKLKHKDSILILLEKLTINKKNYEARELRKKQKHT